MRTKLPVCSESFAGVRHFCELSGAWSLICIPDLHASAKPGEWVLLVDPQFFKLFKLLDPKHRLTAGCLTHALMANYFPGLEGWTMG